jgi:hypothetical protein
VAAYAVAVIVLLVRFSFGGDNGVVYTVSLLGVPIVLGILAGLGSSGSGTRRWAAWRSWPAEPPPGIR